MAVLQKRRRTDGYRSLHCIEEREEVGYQRVGQLRLEKTVEYVLVRRVAQCNLVEVVSLHKFVEHIRTQHERFGYGNRGVVEALQFGMALYDVVEKGQTAPLATQRTVADAGEMAVGVKLTAVEHSHDAHVFHAAILHYRVEDNLSVSVNVLEFVPSHVFQKRRHGEYCSCTQPPAHVIAAYVVEHRVVGNLENVVLQLLQTPYAHYLPVGLWVTEDEVAEAHVLLHDVAQVDAHRLGVLVHEAEALPFSLFTVFCLRTLQYQRHKLIPAPYLAHQFEACFRVFLTIDGESYVTDYAQCVVGIAVIQSHSLLIRSRQHHLRSSALALCRGVWVEGFGGKSLALQQYIVV